MKTLPWIGFIMIALMGCASTNTVAPKWVDQTGAFLMETEALKSCKGAVGSHDVGSQGQGFARTQAGSAARSELAKVFAATMVSAGKGWSEELQKNGRSVAEGLSEAVWKVIGDSIKLSGSEVYATYLNEDQNIAYAIAVYCLDQKRLDSMVEKATTGSEIKPEDIASIRERAAKAFAGLK